MLDRSIVDRLRNTPVEGPVISVYLGLDPDPDQLRAITNRVRALVQPLWDRDASSRDRALRDRLDRVVALAGRARSDLGRGAALFVGDGLEEYVGLPASVRERAIVDVAPYLGPLEAMLAQFPRFCAVVIDRRNAWIYRFHMGELETWEQIGEEEVRKDNFGGFAGYDETRVRGHAVAVAKRLFRSVAGRLAELGREGGYELLLIGGQHANVAGLVEEIPADLKRILAGTFSVDPGTASPSDVRLRCREVVAGYERERDLEEAASLIETAGSGDRAVLGLERVIDASNQRAIDTLLVDVEELLPGVRCPACGWLAVKADGCLVCGGRMRSLPDLVDAVAESTRADGGSVRYLMAHTDLAVHGVAAALRFPVPEQAG